MTDSLPLSLRERLDPVCIAVSAREVSELFRLAVAALRQSRLLELRFDALATAEAPAGAWAGVAGRELREFCRAHPEGTVLATCRRVEGGGGFRGTVAEQLALLAGFARAGAHLVDVELETLDAALEATSRDEIVAFRGLLAECGTTLLVSSHDFEGTGDLPGTLARMRQGGAPAGAAIFKVVSTAKELFDNCRMLRFVERAAREVPVVGLCMGEAGLPSRVLTVRAGSLWTFASAEGGDQTAPGQVGASPLIGEYRVRETGPETRVYGVVGNPVRHSLSPAMHNAGFRAAGVDAVYLPLLTDSIEDVLALARTLPVAGLSVTMPWKVAIVPFLDEVDPLAAAIGAVNTVVQRADGRLWGTNTDAAAVVEPLRARLEQQEGGQGGLRGARVLLLGAGGAARAAAFGLRAAGAAVAILNRTAKAAEELAGACGGTVADPLRLAGYDVVVNATPVGMAGHGSAELPGAGAAALREALMGVRVVFEMVYRPPETPLTRLGSELGIPVITGLEMFVHQGARQWALWTGREAPVGPMRAAVQRALVEPGERDPGRR